VKIKLRPTFGQIGWNWAAAAVAARARESRKSRGTGDSGPFRRNHRRYILGDPRERRAANVASFRLLSKCCPSIIQQRAMTSSRPLGYPQPSVSSFFADSNRRVATAPEIREKWQLRVIIGQITVRITSFPYVDGIRDRGKLSRTRYIRAKLLGIISIL